MVVLTCAAAFAQQPRVDSIMPSQGPIAGGTIVTISGANFTGAAVTLDGSMITPQARSDSTITLAMPAHDNGYAIVSVGGAYARFLYVPPRLQDLPAGYITTVAGIGAYGGEYGPATSAWFSLIWGMAFDPSGRLYFTDTNNGRIMRIRADGVVEPFVTGIHFPRSIAFDSHGNLIVPDDTCLIYRIDPNGVRETIAGTGHCATSAASGLPAKTTAIGQPSYVTLDLADNVYFIDWPTAVVRKIDGSGILTTIAGNGTYGFSGDGGPATSAQFSERFNDDGGLAVDHAGNVLLVDQGNGRVRRINQASGTIETIISGQPPGNLRSITVAADDSIYFSSVSSIYVRAPGGAVTTVVSGGEGFTEDGPLTVETKIGTVYAMVVDSAGNLLYADADVPRVRKIDRLANRISTIAGSGPRVFGEGGPALAAAAVAQGLAFLPTGEMLIAGFNGIFKIDASGRLVRVAGSGTFGPLFDVPALNATMNAPASVTVSRDGIIDFAGIWIARIDREGVVRHTAAKPGACGFAGDGGAAIDALLCQSWDAARDPAGKLVIADTNNNRIRRVDASGVITTIVGSGPPNGLERYGAGSSSGDGGAATDARINTPYGVAFDGSGNLLICEAPGIGTAIRKVDTNGVISTFAHFGCTKVLWAFGNLYTVVGRVVRVSRSGQVIELSPPGDGFSGDGGPASAAHIKANTQASALVADAEGNLYFNDGNNLRIRAIRFGAVLAPPNATIHATAIGSTIRATVLDASGRPAEGVRVELVTPASGASCTASFAITDASGIATTTCTPNCIAGTYSVTAIPLTSASTASVSLTNSPGQCGRRRAVRH